MKHAWEGALLGALCTAALAACQHPSRPLADTPQTPPDSGLQLQYLDRDLRPQDDLYRFVNGRWLETTRIPPDRSNYGAFTVLAEAAEADLRAIIEETAAARPAPGTEARKIGDIYASFMDEARLQALGAEPLAETFAAIDAIDSQAALAAQIAALSKLGVHAPLRLYINQDAKDSTQYAVWFAQSGLGLPDRDYYLADQDKLAATRKAYAEHVETMLALVGDTQAAAHAADILAFETALAEVHWTRVDSRDDDKTYNKLDRSELQSLMPAFDWTAYLDAAGLGVESVIVMQPSAFAGTAELLARTPLPQLRTYLKWHVLSEYAGFLSQPFADEDFAFYGKVLHGTEVLPDRWKRGVRLVEASLGEAVGKIYVERHFPPEAKMRMETLVDNLKRAYRQSISELDWMSEETKAKALTKLSKFTTKIGYPDDWKDYSALETDATDLIGNLMRSRRVEYDRELAKLGQPIDRDEWHMTPQTVNAYYNPGMNEIVFPAAILQPPFFNFEAEDAVNYGGIGAVIGHEIGHGFDDQGSKYDGDGNLKSWWTAEDRAQFEARTKALIEQYDAYCPLEDQCVQGALTIGENIGDLGGLSIALKAYRLSLDGRPGPVMDGFTAEQRVFMGWAQIWRRKYRDEALLSRLKTDPHSPSEYRSNGVVKNIDAFYPAFGVGPDDALYLPPEARVSIW